jgi:hypothetical protein
MAVTASHAVAARVEPPVTPAPTEQPPASIAPKSISTAPIRAAYGGRDQYQQPAWAAAGEHLAYAKNQTNDHPCQSDGLAFVQVFQQGFEKGGDVHRANRERQQEITSALTNATLSNHSIALDH